MNKILLLFEHTGLAAKAFKDLGWQVIAVDILNSETNPWVDRCLDWDILAQEEELKLIAKTCNLVIGFPPCTDLTVAGAKHFKKKAKINPMFQQEALYLAQSVCRIAGNTPWLLENPIGVISTLWRKPDFIFSPHEYGGYLSSDDVHPLYPKYIAPQDAYKKNTCLWLSPDFKLPSKKPVPPEHLGYAVNRQTAYLGGKSLKTKIIRSASPRGFFIGLAEKWSE